MKIIVAMLVLLMSWPAFAQERPAACATIDHSALRPLIHRTTSAGRYVYVTRLWYAMPFENKQSLASYLARCRSAGRWVEIYDAYSGKKLAKFSSSWGYSNYEQ